MSKPSPRALFSAHSRILAGIFEGQNFQDCDYLVNFDIHWNPVRIIQRFGRIDSIGSANATAQLVNFWPTQDLEKYVMSLYNKLLTAAVASIARTFQKRVAAGLQSGRDFVIPNQQDQANDPTDFELVTWLVIKKP